MLETLLKLRVNFLIVFLGAFLLMFLIKLTSLMPSQYYFSFSKLVSSDRGPFIVDPPSITGAKLCELLRKNNISTEQIGISDVDCRVIYEDSAKQSNAKPLSPEVQDQIYGIILRQDANLRAVLQQRLNVFELTPLSNEQLDTILTESKTASEAYDRIRRGYEQQLYPTFQTPIATALDQLFAPILQTKNEEEDKAERPSVQLSETDVSKIRAVHQTFLENIAQRIRQVSLSPIQKSSVDEIMKRPDAQWGIPNSLAGYYNSQIEAVLQSGLKDAFQSQGVALVDKEQARATIFRELAAAGFKDYIIAVVVRILPVILFGLAFGFVFGRKEFTSTSLAAAMTAFLLSWPLILMWEQLVNWQWQDQRPLFIAFYGIYILSFFLTARMAAVLGAWVRQRSLPTGESIGTGDSLLARVSVKEIVFNIAAGVVCNAAVYAWNIVMPSMVA
jgi:hypothetical protein